MPQRAPKRSLSELLWSLLAAVLLALSVVALVHKRRDATVSAQGILDDPSLPSERDTCFAPWWIWAIAGGILVLAGFLGWNLQPLTLRLAPPISADLEKIRLMENRINGAPPEIYYALGEPYETSAYNLSQGKRLYAWFGCARCHGDGRGGSGPSFLDGWWLYGPEMVSIVSSIRDGRPHGMPPFRDKMTIEQIWQLAGYTQTIGAYTAKIAAPGRNDGVYTRPAENRLPASALFEQGPVGANVDQGPKP